MNTGSRDLHTGPKDAEAKQRFVEQTLAWINRDLAPPGVTIRRNTRLFADRLIDSIRILHLIAWTERAIGREIPDRAISMENFQSVQHIADAFLEPLT